MCPAASELWKNGESDPDAVWHRRSDGYSDEAGGGVWRSVRGKGYFWGRIWGAPLSTGTYRAYVCYSAATRPSCQITLGKFVVVHSVVECTEEVGTETGAACHYTIGGVNSKQSIEFFRILRVAVLRLPTGAPSSAHAHHVLPVVYRSFAPQLLSIAAEDGDVLTGAGSGMEQGRRRPESMKETFSKVIVELLNTGTYPGIQVVR